MTNSPAFPLAVQRHCDSIESNTAIITLDVKSELGTSDTASTDAGDLITFALLGNDQAAGADLDQQR